MDYGYGNAALETFFTIYLIVIGVAFLIGVAVYVLTAFAFMALFRKTGIEPWAAWVPFFNTWRILELGGQAGWIVFLAFAFTPGAIVASVFQCIAAYRIGLSFGKTGGWVVLFLFFPYIWAWLLAANTENYNPDLLRQHGYGPPLVGYGSVRGPYVPQNPSYPPAPPAA